MKPTFNEKLLAYLVLISGLAISGVAEYYSIMGLIAIYPAAVWPIVIMGIVLGLGKITGTVWLKQNWAFAPWFLKTYILPAIAVLMIITSLGVFGYLSKAHSDQSLVSGDVSAKIAVYDDKIKIAKDNIDANRKALKQMDEAVDQVMGRSADEKGADKAVAIRRGQAKERTRLLSEITAEQKIITQLSEERAPIAAEVRKVEAEVGPIKYIAHLFYGENPDANVLEKAVIWVTVLIVIVLDPLAVVLLLASQYSFQRFRELEEPKEFLLHETVPVVVTEVEENKSEGDSPVGPVVDIVSPLTTVTEQVVEEVGSAASEWDYQEQAETPKPVVEEVPLAEKHPYLNQPFVHFKDMQPMVSRIDEPVAEPTPEPVPEPASTGVIVERPPQAVVVKTEESRVVRTKVFPRPPAQESPSLFVQNEEQLESNLWTKTATPITPEEYVQTSISRQELTINEWVDKVRNKEIKMSDVPEHLLLDIRARI